MSYNSVVAMARDADLQDRVTAAVAQEGISNPERWRESYMWQIAGAPGWAEAWDYAVASGNERPGHDEGVITDGMILAAVQAAQQ